MDELKKKLLEGAMTEEEWQALDTKDREQALVTAAVQAVRAAGAAKAKACEGRLAAGALFAEEDKPPEGSENLLPAGYVLAVEGVYRIITKKTNGNLKVHAERMTTAPIFVAARDITSGRVKVLVRLYNVWYAEWVLASRLTPAKLAEWFVFPAHGVKVCDVIEYLRECIACAPYVVTEDEVALAAVEILQEFFLAKAAGIEFPALRAFTDVRKKAEERGVDPLAIRRWWSRQGLITDGVSKVVRQGPGTARMIAFTAKVRDLLEKVPDRPREGKIFRIKFLTGPRAGEEMVVAREDVRVIPIGAEKIKLNTPLAAALAGRWPGEVTEVRAPGERYMVQVLEILPEPEPQTQTGDSESKDGQAHQEARTA
jgi:hypothetical protein